MAFTVRETTPDERRRANDTFREALLYAPVTDAEWSEPWVQGSWDGSNSLSAWEGDRCIGHAAAFDLRTVVPGGAVLATAGVTRVGVLPTHTRRGVLTALLTQLLTDARARGKVLASLRASEAVIYGRFGFGVAGEYASVEIDTGPHTRFARHRSDGSVRRLDRTDVMAVVPPLADRLGHDRPGVLVRPAWMHSRLLGDATAEGKSTFVAVHCDSDGRDDGWVAYAVAWDEGEYGTRPRGTCEVLDLWGADSHVELALWRHVLDLDLVEVVRSDERPIDDTVRYAMDDSRAYRFIAVDDEQWLRLIDVDAALRARTYSTSSASLSIAIDDPLLDANTGVWRVSATGAERIDLAASEADITADIAAISAAYLGGTPWWACAARGLAVERRPGALAEADDLFAHRPAPFCGSHF